MKSFVRVASCHWSHATAAIGALVTAVASLGCLGSGDDGASLWRPSASLWRPSDGSDGADASALKDGSDEAQAGEAGIADSSVDAHAEIADAMVDGTSSLCSVEETHSVHAGAASSAGFAGTDAQRYALYNVACQTAQDCVNPCVSAGGTTTSCTNGSSCSQGFDGGMACLPPPYWLSVDGALSESGTIGIAAQLILVAIPYMDSLVLTKFGVSIPDDAIVMGIEFDIRRGTLAADAVDDTVQLLQNGVPVGENRAQTPAWPALPGQTSDLTTEPYRTYGGANDTWGVAWTVAEIRSNGFGISIAAKYVGAADGNERAYIDSVRAIVFYKMWCE